jgi:hypothetical protein
MRSRARIVAEDEPLLLETRPHVAALAPALARSLALVAVSVAVSGWLTLAQPRLWRLGVGVLALAAAYGAVRALRAVWRWDRTVLAVTATQVVLARRGIRSRTMSVPLAALDGLSIDQTLLGRLLGYGTLVLEDGRGRRGLRFVPHPAEVGGLILRLRP